MSYLLRLCISLIFLWVPNLSAKDFYQEDVRAMPLLHREAWREYLARPKQNIYPGVVVLSDGDYAKMLSAAEQWSRVAQTVARLFYTDPAALTPYIPEPLLQYWRSTYPEPQIDPDRVHFIAGLDLLRDLNGDLSIIEVNTSVVSGIWASEELLRPLAGALGIDYSNLSVLERGFREMMQALPDGHHGAMVNVQYDIYTLGRLDDYAAAFAAAQPTVDELNFAQGMRTVYLGPLESAMHVWNSVTPDFLNLDWNHAISRSSGESLEIRVLDGELRLRARRGSERSDMPVRLIWPQMLNRNLFEYIPGLWNLFRDNKLALAQTPGVDFLENKLLQSYMNNLIRGLSGEEPVIAFADTESFFLANGQFAEAHFSQIAQNPDGWVFKPVAAQGGEGVILGHELRDPDRVRRLRSEIRTNPFSYVAQHKLSSSIVPDPPGLMARQLGRKIDFRAFAFARTVGGEARVNALPLISSRGVARTARTHNVAGNLGATTSQLVLAKSAFLRLSDCAGLLAERKGNFPW